MGQPLTTADFPTFPNQNILGWKPGQLTMHDYCEQFVEQTIEDHHIFSMGQGDFQWNKLRSSNAPLVAREFGYPVAWLEDHYSASEINAMADFIMR